MFDNLVSSAVFPAVLEIVRALDNSLTGVRTRLTALANGDDHINAIIAKAEIAALECWEPALKDIMTALDKSHQAVHGKPLPPPGAGRGH